MNIVEEKNTYSKKNVGPIFFVTPNVNRAIGLEKELDDFHIICSQDSDAIGCMQKEGVSVFRINDDDIKSSGKLLESKSVLSYIKNKSKDRRANILTFKPSPKTAKICADNGFGYLGNNWKLNRKFENKIEFVGITEGLKIPNAQSRVVRIKNDNLSECFPELKNREWFVIQLPRGFSGNSTFLIKNEKDLKKAAERHKGRIVKVSKYIRGETYTVNACVGKFGVAVSQPIYQITGLTSYNRNKLGTSGNDYAYAENLSIEEKKKIFEFTQKVGGYMNSLGYKGIFGLDLIVADDKVDLIEINPRLIGSIPVFTKLQIMDNQIPFLALHILEFLDYDYQIGKTLDYYCDFRYWSEKINFNVSQLILRNTEKDSLRIEKSFSSGIYKMNSEYIALKKNAYYAERILREDEFFIQCPRPGSLINPDMEYANIQAGYGIIKNGVVSEKFERILRLISGKINFKKEK